MENAIRYQGKRDEFVTMKEELHSPSQLSKQLVANYPCLFDLSEQSSNKIDSCLLNEQVNNPSKNRIVFFF